MNNYYWSIICVDAFLLGMLIGMVAYTFALIRKYATVHSVSFEEAADSFSRWLKEQQP